jgi:hypothetical protein
MICQDGLKDLLIDKSFGFKHLYGTLYNSANKIILTCPYCRNLYSVLPPNNVSKSTTKHIHTFFSYDWTA